ncbi:MAG: hypothetical protein ACRDM0_25000, partial [Thermoleophilaceae bacterium]
SQSFRMSRTWPARRRLAKDRLLSETVPGIGPTPYVSLYDSGSAPTQNADRTARKFSPASTWA